MFVKIKQNLCANVPKGDPQKFNVQRKNYLKSYDCEQFTMQNRPSNRSRFPDKFKIKLAFSEKCFCIA